MYLLGAEAEITWEIAATEEVIASTDLDLIILNPEGVEVYINSPILPENFLAPTASTAGYASYTFSPDVQGLWTTRLVVGTISSYVQLSKVEMQVLDNTTTTNPVASFISTQVTSEAIKVPCVVITTANLTLSGLQTVDGVALAENDRVIVNDQTDATENGIYNASAGDWIRSNDFNEDSEITNGVIVLENNNGIAYRVLFTGDLDIGITEISFSSFAITDAPLQDIINNVGYAQEWAQNPVDVHVSVDAGGGTDPDDYSALHFAAKAYDNYVLTAADVLTTGIAVVSTEQNVVIAEAAATEAVNEILYVRASWYAPRATETNLDDNGDPSTAGDIYYNTTLLKNRTYDGVSWGDAGNGSSSANTINIADSGDYYTGVNVEVALQEIFAGKTFTDTDLINPTVNAIPALGLVILDTPERLATYGAKNADWINTSTLPVNAQTTILPNALAKKAIIRMYAFAQHSSTTSLLVTGEIRPTDDVSGYVGCRIVSSGRNERDTPGLLSVLATGESIVNLDANHDFDFKFDDSATTGATYIVYLVGYYV